MKLLLKQLHSRAEILADKIVGRTGVVTVAILAGLIAAFAVVLAFLGSFSISIGNSFALAGLTILLALTYVGVTVAISASTKSTNLAAAGAIGVFLVFQFLWSSFRCSFCILLMGSRFQRQPRCQPGQSSCPISVPLPRLSGS